MTTESHCEVNLNESIFFLILGGTGGGLSHEIAGLLFLRLCCHLVVEIGHKEFLQRYVEINLCPCENRYLFYSYHS